MTGFEGLGRRGPIRPEGEGKMDAEGGRKSRSERRGVRRFFRGMGERVRGSRGRAEEGSGRIRSFFGRFRRPMTAPDTAREPIDKDVKSRGEELGKKSEMFARETKMRRDPLGTASRTDIPDTSIISRRFRVAEGFSNEDLASAYVQARRSPRTADRELMPRIEKDLVARLQNISGPIEINAEGTIHSFSLVEGTLRETTRPGPRPEVLKKAISDRPVVRPTPFDDLPITEPIIPDPVIPRPEPVIKRAMERPVEPVRKEVVEENAERMARVVNGTLKSLNQRYATAGYTMTTRNNIVSITTPDGDLRRIRFDFGGEDDGVRPRLGFEVTPVNESGDPIGDTRPMRETVGGRIAFGALADDVASILRLGRRLADGPEKKMREKVRVDEAVRKEVRRKEVVRKEVARKERLPFERDTEISPEEMLKNLNSLLSANYDLTGYEVRIPTTYESTGGNDISISGNGETLRLTWAPHSASFRGIDDGSYIRGYTLRRGRDWRTAERMGDATFTIGEATQAIVRALNLPTRAESERLGRMFSPVLKRLNEQYDTAGVTLETRGRYLYGTLPTGEIYRMAFTLGGEDDGETVRRGYQITTYRESEGGIRVGTTPFRETNEQLADDIAAVLRLENRTVRALREKSAEMAAKNMLAIARRAEETLRKTFPAGGTYEMAPTLDAAQPRFSIHEAGTENFFTFEIVRGPGTTPYQLRFEGGPGAPRAIGNIGIGSSADVTATTTAVIEAVTKHVSRL